jgi:hypothetical protein
VSACLTAGGASTEEAEEESALERGRKSRDSSPLRTGISLSTISPPPKAKSVSSSKSGFFDLTDDDRAALVRASQAHAVQQQVFTEGENRPGHTDG